MIDKTSNDTSSKRATASELFMLFTVVAAIAALLVNKVYDLDVWWHISIGNDILHRMAIPLEDHFAAASLGRYYHDSHWLSQVVLALADRVAGMAGVEVVMVVIWSLAFFFCYRAARRWASPVVASLLFFLAAMACAERFHPRPEIVTCLMIAIYYWLLQEGKYRSLSRLTMFAGLQAIWSNSHGLFIIGPFMVGCYWLVAAVGRARGNREGFVHLTRLFGVVLAATLLTPYGVGGWSYALLLFTEIVPASFSVAGNVGELSPTFGAAARSGYAVWFFAVLLVGVIVTAILRLSRRRICPERLLIVIGMGAAAMTGRRNIVLLALVAAPFLAEQLRPLLPEKVKGGKALALLASLPILGWVWFTLSGDYSLKVGIPSEFGLGVTPSYFPHGLPAFLDRVGFQGQVFNSNNLGGFYLYHGYPRRIPLTDGRWEVYEQDHLQTIIDSPGNPVLWPRLVSTYDIRGLLLQHISPEAKTFLPSLAKDHQWRLVYLDHAASFWIRDDIAGFLAEIDLTNPEVLPPHPSNIHDCLILDSFLMNVHAGDLRIANLKRALTFGKATENLLEQIGREQIRLGRMQEAESTFQRLNRLYPQNKTALFELAYFAATRREFEKAESLLSRLLAIDPSDKDARASYQKVRDEMRSAVGGK